jgi:hypothetical protein
MTAANTSHHCVDPTISSVRFAGERWAGRIAEVDATFIGGVTPGAKGRDGEGKVMVVMTAEEAGLGIGRIHLPF